MEIRWDFTKETGTEINKDKSDIYFFNTPLTSPSFLARTMGFQIGKFPTKYLGIQLSDK